MNLSANFIPPLDNGDQLSREELEQRCLATANQFLLTKTQSDPNDRNNWVKLHCQTFRF